MRSVFDRNVLVRRLTVHVRCCTQNMATANTVPESVKNEQWERLIFAEDNTKRGISIA